MTNEVQALVAKRKVMRFNAPFGARCFLTSIHDFYTVIRVRLNAPFGARCFLTINYCEAELTLTDGVLMHRLALGAF